MKSFKVTALLMGVCATVFAQNGDFGYKRVITAGDSAGWYAIAVPPDMYAHIRNDFSDLRIYRIHGGDTAEIPWLVKTHQQIREEENLSLPLVNKSTKEGVLYLTFQKTADKQINRVEFDFAEDNYFATVKVEGSPDGSTWYTLADDKRLFSLTDTGKRIRHQQVDFPATNYRWLRFAIKADQELTLAQAAVKHIRVSPGIYENVPVTWTVEHDRKDKTTTVLIRPDHYRRVDRLSLVIHHDMDYYRNYTLSYLVDSTRTEKGWHKNYRIIRRGFLTAHTPGEIEMAEVITSELKLTVDNGDNPPVTIRTVEAQAPVVHVIARLSPGESQLLYGNKKIRTPSYDLKWFQDKIPDALPLARLGAEENIGTDKGPDHVFTTDKAWLWIIMVGGIVVLAFATWKMMSGYPPRD